MKLFQLGCLISLGVLVVSCSKKEEDVVEVDPGRELVMESIAAHGGKEKWYGNGALKFRWVYHQVDRGPNAVVNTVQTVDPKTLANVHEVEGQDIKFGMDAAGEYWISPADAKFAPPYRFWALTPYYFFGIPFVFNDENAEFEKLAETKEFEGKEYEQVKITYNQNAGDSPDDYYVLLIDPETKLTRGTYYIVTSDLLGRDKVGPEKFLSLDNLQDVNGVKLSGGHRTFRMADGKIGEEMRYSEISEVQWLKEGSVSFDAPE